MTETQIARLVGKAKKGDQQAFEKLIDQKKRTIAYIALSILKNEQDAEDAVQEAILAMYRSMHMLNSNKAFSSWMYKTVYRSCLKVQDEKRKQAATVLDQSDNDRFAEKRIELIPHKSQEIQEQRDYVLKKLSLLNDNYRISMYLFYIEDMSYDQIAEIMGAQKKDIANWLNRGRRKLKEEIVKDGKSSIWEESTLVSSPAIVAAFQHDMDTVLIGDKERIVEQATEVALAGAVSTGVGTGGLVGVFSGALFSNAAPLVALLSTVTASIVLGLVLWHPGFAPEPPQGGTVGESAILGNSGDEKVEEPEHQLGSNDRGGANLDEGGDGEALRGSATTGENSIEGNSEEGSNSFIIENEVLYEIMDPEDKDSLESEKDPDKTSNTVSTEIVQESQIKSPYVKTGDWTMYVVLSLVIAAMVSFLLLWMVKRKTYEK